MPQINRTTNELIINSLYLLGELGVGETADAFMLSTGLDLINELLDKFSLDSIYIPFLTTIDFTFEVGKDTYSISDMIPADIVQDRVVDLSFANFEILPGVPNPVVYPLKIISKAEYYNVVRIKDMVTLPSYIFLNKQANESFVVVYPAPDKPYPCSLQCKVMLNSLGPQDDLSELQPYYYGFLKYALARKFLSYYPSGNWPQYAEDEYQDYYNSLKNSNETDLTVRPSIIGNSPEPFYWNNLTVLY